MQIYGYTDYKECVNDWVRSQPRKGHGLYKKIAEYLGTNSAIVSQIFKSDRQLTLEQAVKVGKFLGLGAMESDYFLLLVQMERAGSVELKKVLLRQIHELRLRGQALKNRLKHRQLNENDKALFYSSWTYLATWLTATLPKMSSSRQIADHFQVPEPVIMDILTFLLQRGLLVGHQGGYRLGTEIIHLPHDSHYIAKHHFNWRIKAMQNMDKGCENNFFYSAPMAMSHALRARLRERIVRLIEKSTKEVLASKSETLVCFNVDFFSV